MPYTASLPHQPHKGDTSPVSQWREQSLVAVGQAQTDEFIADAPGGPFNVICSHTAGTDGA